MGLARWGKEVGGRLGGPEPVAPAGPLRFLPIISALGSSIDASVLFEDSFEDESSSAPPPPVPAVPATDALAPAPWPPWEEVEESVSNDPVRERERDLVEGTREGVGVGCVGVDPRSLESPLGCEDGGAGRC